MLIDHYGNYGGTILGLLRHNDFIKWPSGCCKHLASRLVLLYEINLLLIAIMNQGSHGSSSIQPINALVYYVQ